MIRTNIFSLPLLGLFCIGGLVAETAAQEAKQAKATPAPKDGGPALMAIQLHNGTIIKQALLETQIEIETRYGKFVLPAGDIKRIEFGFRIPPEDQARLASALANLTKGQFQEREAATQELIALGRLAYPALVKAGKGGDLETTRRVEKVLEEIRKTTPQDQLKTVEEDSIHTTAVVLKGKITTDSLKLKAKVVGAMELPLGHVFRVRSMTGTKLLALQGSGSQPWVDTGIEVSVGSQLDIKVNGTLTFDIRGSRHTTTPRGNPQLTSVLNSNVPQNVNRPIGLVFARIGQDGAPFEVGRGFQGPAASDGKLYLQVYTGGPHDFPITGAYQVEIDAY